MFNGGETSKWPRRSMDAASRPSASVSLAARTNDTHPAGGVICAIFVDDKFEKFNPLAASTEEAYGDRRLQLADRGA